MMSREARYDNLQFIALSAVGLSHQRKGVKNQDAVAFDCIDNDYYIAVSDGVGSCPMAEAGSLAAIEASKRVFGSIKSKKLPQDAEIILENLISEWKATIADSNINDYCATLKLVIKLDNKLLLFSIGDGLLIITSEGLKVASPQDETLFANQTQCLNETVTSSDFWTSEFPIDTDVAYVAFLCTDGVANGIAEGMELELVREIESGTAPELLKSELESLIADISDYSFDDKTVGVVKYERKNGKS